MSKQEHADLVIVGTGVAGLSATLAAAHAGAEVLLLTGGPVLSGSSPWAQGGIAAAIGADDRPALHAADTLAVGAQLNDRRAVQVLVNAGRAAIQRLLDDGLPFDGGAAAPELGLEAGHGRRRILHAGGEATGRMVTTALLSQVVEHQQVRVRAHTPAQQLITAGPRVVGVRSGDATYTGQAVVLATGGYASLWSRTTNAPENRGTGLLLAWQAGATLADLEFVQFHPTALSLPGRRAFLLSEALRGEGARLLDAQEHPIVDPLLPRDVVARAVARHLRGQGPVYLSLRHLDPEFVRGRFPNIAAQLADWGLDLAGDLLPIAPAAHYCMGGVRTDVDGRTDLPGLYVAGEAACTGVQGANRLASNSLLECLVFGSRATHAALSDAAGRRAHWHTEALPGGVQLHEAVVGGMDQAAGSEDSGADTVAHTNLPAGSSLPPLGLRASRAWARLDSNALGELLDRDLGVERDAATLAELLDALPEPEQVPSEPATLAGLVAHAALLRGESRGAHFRADAPETDPRWRGRIHWQRGTSPRFERIER